MTAKLRTKERSGNPELPQWWLNLAMPRLASAGTNDAEIARRASAVAGRSNPWTPSAIVKFRQGQGRTVALTNGISAALGIVPPFFVAPTEGSATIIAEIVRNEQSHIDEKTTKLTVADQYVSTEIRNAVVDAQRAPSVRSSDYGSSRGDGVRTRVSRRRRP